MATSSLKMQLAQALASYLGTAIPGLTVIAGSADPEQKMQHPSLQIVPHKMTFTPSIDQVVAGGDDTDDVVITGSNTDMIVDLGEFEGPIELRLVARNQPQREQYQAAVLAALNVVDETPGVTTLTLPSLQFETSSGTVVTNVSTQVAVFLDFEDWDEEHAWDKHRFTFIEVTGQFPLLVLRQSVPNIEHLILELADLPGDLIDEANIVNPPGSSADDVIDVGAIPPGDIESVQVNDDGSITNA